MKIYLDCCSLQRPFDDRSQLRIRVEAEAILSVLSLFESGELELINSDAIELEVGNISDWERRFFCQQFLLKIKDKIKVNEEVEKLARKYVSNGIKPLDALHLALASVSGADFFCTCDDTFYKKAKSEGFQNMKIVKPMELIEDIEYDY
jgi:predicted nucleic acid-binding protein